MKIKSLTALLAATLAALFLVLAYILLEIRILGQLSAEQDFYLQLAINFVGATFFGVLLIGSYIRQTIVAPVEALVKHTEQIAAGNYTARTTIHTRNELSALADGFNDMSAAIERDIQAREQAEQQLLAAKNQLEALAHVDGLTNIPNRRFFDEQLNNEWRRAQRAQLPLAILMIDIDFFKPYNDNNGHSAGDECLKQVASALAKALVRPADLIARYGGEEFVAMLPETGVEGLRQTAERLCSAVANLALPHPHSLAAPHVTISLGGASTLPTADTKPAALLATADAMLYQAKKLGRNQVCIEP